jgi:hypothetical protein
VASNQSQFSINADSLMLCKIFLTAFGFANKFDTNCLSWLTLPDLVAIAPSPPQEAHIQSIPSEMEPNPDTEQHSHRLVIRLAPTRTRILPYHCLACPRPLKHKSCVMALTLTLVTSAHVQAHACSAFRSPGPHGQRHPSQPQCYTRRDVCRF